MCSRGNCVPECQEHRGKRFPNPQYIELKPKRALELLSGREKS